MLRSIEFPLRFIRLDDHKLGIFGTDILGVISCCFMSLMRTFKNKNTLKTIEDEISKKIKNNEARPKFTGSYKKKLVYTL